MPVKPMVHLVTASGTFHARVISARLGAAGILSEVRGGTEGPYPLSGCVEVLVPDSEADDARQLLAEDARRTALEPAAGSVDRPVPSAVRTGAVRWVSLAVIGIVLATAVLIASAAFIARLA